MQLKGARLQLSELASDLIFTCLIAINCVRLFRHAMWRDELQAFMLAAASSTPLELFTNLRYEGHPGLWHLLLWLITRFTSDPIWMQVAHLLITLGIWGLIWRVSPFKPYEKLLLLLSYYLFWEYFVVSRNYALGVLLAFGFVALWVHRPAQRFWPWVLLGLLANTSVFGAIWSFGLAALFALRHRTDWRELLPGVATFAVLTTFAVATMIPSQDRSLHRTPSFAIEQADVAVRFVIDAFFPFVSSFVRSTLVYIGAPLAHHIKAVGSDPVGMLSKFIEASPALTAAVLVMPILACLIIVQDRLLVASYAAIIISIILFVMIWDFPGEHRHHGHFFVALIGTVWLWRALPSKKVTWVWIGLLVINALAGLATLSSELRPYSQSHNAAIWLKLHNLQNEFLIGSRDANTSSVVGYLQRPIYYLECECFGTYVRWSRARNSRLSLEEFLARIARVFEAEQKDSAIVIVHQPYDPAEQTLMPELKFERLESMVGAIKNENYVIYRVTKVNSE